MEKRTEKALYAYFGELGIFEDNIPGHSFYQLGLMHSLAQKYKIDKFDFLNYIDPRDKISISNIQYRPVYPSDSIGEVFRKYTDLLIDEYRIHFELALSRLKSEHYSKLFLKARFRNLSTLEKKLDDAAKFEILIKTALEIGFDPASIVIVDTDLSLSDQFIEYLDQAGITREIPSITVAGISCEFLDACFTAHRELPFRNMANIVYYGNLSFDNYKTGHSKNPIAWDILTKISSQEMIDGRQFFTTIAAKETKEIKELVDSSLRLELIPRENRNLIWKSLTDSGISLNVSKDLYLKHGFIPARVYESLIFGLIPVSYKWGYRPMSFETVDQFFEICKFLVDCSKDDYLKILTRLGDIITADPSLDK